MQTFDDRCGLAEGGFEFFHNFDSEHVGCGQVSGGGRPATGSVGVGCGVCSANRMCLVPSAIFVAGVWGRGG
jgi:hypothetical protein